MFAFGSVSVYIGSMEAIIFIVVLTAVLGLSWWLPVLLPIAIGGFSLYMGLLECRFECRKNNHSTLYMVTSMIIASVILFIVVRSAFVFPTEYSGELFCREILPFLDVTFH